MDLEQQKVGKKKHSGIVGNSAVTVYSSSVYIIMYHSKDNNRKEQQYCRSLLFRDLTYYSRKCRVLLLAGNVQSTFSAGTITLYVPVSARLHLSRVPSYAITLLRYSSH